MVPALTLSGWLRYSLVRDRLTTMQVRSVLEIGPGLGALGARLAMKYEYVGVEIDPESALIARERLARIGRGTVVTGTIGHVGEHFDLVCAFEVLEHIEDDAGALAEWRERILPGGWLTLSVPARQELWGAHDERAGHFRRYDRAGLMSLLAQAGYENLSILSYGYPLLTTLHPLWNALSRRARRETTLEARTRASGRFRQPPEWVGLPIQLIALPFAVVQRRFVDSDHGTGFVVFAHRAD